MSNFDDYLNAELNKKIEKTLNIINSQLRDCESNIKKYFNSPIINNELQNSIKMNMKQSLLTNLTNFTKKFKINQKIYSEKYKEFVGEEDPTFDFSSSFKDNNNNSEDKKGGFLMTEDPNQNLQIRDNELSLLLNNVSELATIFKDIQTLVMEQGSILDRIDYNIDIAGENVVKAHKSLAKADEYHKQNCFRNVMLVLMVVIFIEVFILLFKFL